MNAITQSKIMEFLYALKSMAIQNKSYVKASIYDVSTVFQAVENTILPKCHYRLSKEDFIAKMFDISLTYNILDLKYGITSCSNSPAEIELAVYVEKSFDNTSNITPEIIEILYSLPIF